MSALTSVCLSGQTAFGLPLSSRTASEPCVSDASCAITRGDNLVKVTSPRITVVVIARVARNFRKNLRCMSFTPLIFEKRPGVVDGKRTGPVHDRGLCATRCLETEL